MTGLSNRRSVMTLYADVGDPLGHSVMLVLREKDINSNVVLVPDGTRPEILNDFNPYETTLTLVDRDLVLYDSHTILEYLDERYPHPPLMPVDPVARANNRQFRYRIVSDLYNLALEITGENELAAVTARKAMRNDLMAICPLFSQHTYFMSDEFSLVDICLVPILWRLPSYGIELGSPGKPLLKYADLIFGRKAFQESLDESDQVFRETP
jgi:stringent starvation protein A